MHHVEHFNYYSSLRTSVDDERGESHSQGECALRDSSKTWAYTAAMLSFWVDFQIVSLCLLLPFFQRTLLGLSTIP
eukprot:1033993-Amphidinium_carterae.1